MKDKLKNKLSILLPFMGLIFVLLVFLVFILIKDPEKMDSFFSLGNMKNILKQTVIVGIASLGMTLVIISGGIDLSAGSVVALGSVIFAIVLKTGAGDGEVTGMLVLGAFLATLGVCALVGFLNGLITAKFDFMPFIVTLGTMQIARGVAKWIGDNERVRTSRNFFQDFMLFEPNQKWLFFAPSVWIMFVLTIIIGVMLKYSVLGRYIYAIDSNEETAKLCGINVTKCKILIYTLSGVLIGIAACMFYADSRVGNPTGAVGLELNIIAAVVIGGASLNGGEGSALGSLVGALIMAVLDSGCTQMGV